MEDSSIVSLYMARDERAIEETAGKYGCYCRSIAQRILGNREDAQECVNQAYLAAWNSIPPNQPTYLSTYLGKIVRRLSLSTLRLRNAKRRGGGETAAALDELLDCVPSGKDIDAQLEDQAQAALLNSFVRRLPADERDMFIRRYWYLDSVRDLCKQFSVSQSMVKTTLYRTRKKLLTALEKEGIFI